VAGKVKLKIAIAEFPHTSAIRSGAIEIEGVEPEIITVQPQIGAFRRMVRNVEFDVCELAPTTYIIARAYGAPFVGLPIFVTRNFHHGGLQVREDKGIKHPKDLEGHKVGVRAYSVTTGVWTRAILMEEFGVDNSKITWVVDDEEHVQQMKLPSNVIHTAEGVSLYDMIMSGELVAGFHGAAGVGRTGSPAGGWKTMDVPYPDLFPNAAELEADWYNRTGIYPMHGTIVVKDEILKEHPWVAKSLFNAFTQAKNDWLKRFQAGEDQGPTDKKYRKLAKIVGPDPLPYGMDANIKTILALEDTAFKQKLTPKKMTVDELFVDPEKL
jgi:4,5-dihydroxyphthalate decarboxylase